MIEKEKRTKQQGRFLQKKSSIHFRVQDTERPEEQGDVGASHVVPLLMWAQDTGQGAQLCLTRPLGQLVLVHPSSGQGSGVGRGEIKVVFKTLHDDQTIWQNQLNY